MIKSKQYSDERRIVGFVCNWGAYSGVDMAGVNKRQYPANVKLVRVACMGRLQLGLILQAFELGADGVMLLGCPPAECHYESGMEKAAELFAQARVVLQLPGIGRDRLALIKVPVGRDDILVRQVATFAKGIKPGLITSPRRRGLLGRLD